MAQREEPAPAAVALFQQVAELLRRHIVPEVLSSDEIFERDSLPTAQGTDLTVDRDARTIQGGSIGPTDNEAENGSILHAINLVLI